MSDKSPMQTIVSGFVYQICALCEENKTHRRCKWCSNDLFFGIKDVIKRASMDNSEDLKERVAHALYWHEKSIRKIKATHPSVEPKEPTNA